MLSFLAWFGRHSGLFMLAGLIVVPILPVPRGVLLPFLPLLVTLLIGLAIARMDLRELLADLSAPRKLVPTLGFLAIYQPLAALAAVWLCQKLGTDPALSMAALVFFAAPPLSSAPNVAMMLGYSGTIALRLTLVGTLTAPLLVPASLWMGGIPFPIHPAQIATKVLVMLGAGFVIGILIRKALGGDRIRACNAAFNGVSAIVMLCFLFPLMDGVVDLVAADPILATTIGAWALGLNWGSNMVMRLIAARLLHCDVANAVALVFGNRNISILLAALPYDPALSLFVALAQVPIYLTPLVFRVIDRLRPWQDALTKP